MNAITYEEGLTIARKCHLESEYMALIADGFTPYEALEDWDMLDNEINNDVTKINTEYIKNNQGAN